MDSAKSIFIKMIISSWDIQNARINKLLEGLSDEQLAAETAPGRNTGLYLIGHLAAISDGMIPIMGWGERIYPQWDEIFVSKPDKSGQKMPSPSEVRDGWNSINAKVSGFISGMNQDEWFARHTLVTKEDFEKEPHRNKLNILVNRSNHHSYHYGQLAFLAKRK